MLVSNSRVTMSPSCMGVTPDLHFTYTWSIPNVLNLAYNFPSYFMYFTCHHLQSIVSVYYLYKCLLRESENEEKKLSTRCLLDVYITPTWCLLDVYSISGALNVYRVDINYISSRYQLVEAGYEHKAFKAGLRPDVYSTSARICMKVSILWPFLRRELILQMAFYLGFTQICHICSYHYSPMRMIFQ